MKKSILIVFLIILLTVGLIITAFYCVANYNLKNIQLRNSKETSISQYIETQNSVADYIRNNIGQLSEEPAVLGGSFYVTYIKFLSPESCLVSYEDGHIALQALAEFKVTADNNIEILSFTKQEL